MTIVVQPERWVDTASARTSGRNSAAADTTGTIPNALRLIHVDRGSVVRLRDAAGTRVRSIGGVAWITEQRRDGVSLLLPGDSHTFRSNGNARVVAERTSCIVLETPAGVPPPASVELAVSEPQLATTLASRRRSLLRALLAWWQRPGNDQGPPVTAAAPVQVPHVGGARSADTTRDRLLHVDPH